MEFDRIVTRELQEDYLPIVSATYKMLWSDWGRWRRIIWNWISSLATPYLGSAEIYRESVILKLDRRWCSDEAIRILVYAV